MGVTSVVVDVAEERVALLESPPPHPSTVPVSDGEILPSPAGELPAPSDGDEAPKAPGPKQRLVSLDVFRGLTVALMILVDDAGGAFPSINHSPWTGVTLADFVMPFFLFGVGVSVALVFKKPPNRAAATKKVVERSIKLFLLGLLLQGGYFHGRNHLTYGLDIDHIRWLGVLQRISIGYFLAGITEIWLASDILVDSAFAFVKRYYIECSLAAAVTCFIGLQFGHVIVHLKGHVKIVLSWSLTSLMLLLGGYIMQRLGLPLSKPLYTVSYMFVTAGLSGIVLTAIYCMVDVKQFRKPTLLLQWMGMNALIVYALAACELFPAAIQGFYWRSPENNLVNLSESLLQAILHSKSWGTLVFVFLEIIFWCLVAGYLHMKGIYIKL